MKLMTRLISACIGLAAGANLTLADHNHITVDTVGGNPGDQVIIRAGYLPAESEFTISGGRLLHDDVIAVYDVMDQLSQPGLLNGWYAGDELLLTSDFYFATGRLDGGNFQYELAQIVPLSGGPGEIAWGEFVTGGFVPSAFSTGATRLARSFDTGIGGHAHAQGYALSTPGLYDVTFVAWDSNGRYADSDPVTVRINVVPEPGTLGLLVVAALYAVKRP